MAPNQPIRIHEAATPVDFAQVRALLLEYAESLGWDLTSGGRLAREIEDLPGPYRQPEGTLLLACVGPAHAGVIGLQPVPVEARVPGTGTEAFGELKRLFVRPEFRRTGIAKALLRRSETEARVRRYRALVLTTSAEMMPLAQGLYESLGYVTTEPYRDDMPYPGIEWLRLDL